MPPYYQLTQQANPDFSAWDDPDSPYWIHGFESHLPGQASLREDMAVYFGMVSLMDREIGRILDALDRLDLARNTLVVFTTDHGHFLGQHGLTAKGPFHYEDMLRIPLIVRAPGSVLAGRVLPALQSHVDFAPTFLDALGISVPGSLQGSSQWASWTGQTSASRTEVIVENRHQPNTMHLRTYVNERYKLTVHRGQPYGELFDLAADPDERLNLWDEPASQRLKASLMAQFLDADLRREATRYPRIGAA